MAQIAKIFKYQFEPQHYKGMSVLQRHYGKKISTSNSKDSRALYKKVLERITEIKSKQYYTTKEKIWLNNLRMEFLKDKAKEGYNFR